MTTYVHQAAVVSTSLWRIAALKQLGFSKVYRHAALSISLVDIDRALRRSAESSPCTEAFFMARSTSYLMHRVGMLAYRLMHNLLHVNVVV